MCGRSGEHIVQKEEGKNERLSLNSFIGSGFIRNMNKVWLVEMPIQSSVSAPIQTKISRLAYLVKRCL